MSTLNILYPAKITIKSLIKQIFDRVYNQLPLTDVDYPFAVYSVSIIENCPGSKLEVIIDLWNNELKLTEFNQLADRLIDKLDRISHSDDSIHFSGEVIVIRDIPTMEENLNRIQIQAAYDLYKVK